MHALNFNGVMCNEMRNSIEGTNLVVDWQNDVTYARVVFAKHSTAHPCKQTKLKESSTNIPYKRQKYLKVIKNTVK